MQFIERGSAEALWNVPKDKTTSLARISIALAFSYTTQY